jgi:hypothetical protein
MDAFSALKGCLGLENNEWTLFLKCIPIYYYHFLWAPVERLIGVSGVGWGCWGAPIGVRQKWYTGAGASWVVSDLVLAWYGLGYTLKTLLPSPFGGG